MQNVYVADWNGYSGGIFRTLDVAVESLAIGAVYKGIDGYQKYLAEFEREIEPLAKLGVGGSRMEHHLYAIMTSDYMKDFSIVAQDIDVKAGYSPVTETVLSNDMNDPRWAIQKALYDFATDNFDDIDALAERLYAEIEHQVENVKSDTSDLTAAMKVLAGEGSLLLAPMAREIEPQSGDDAASYLEALPERAVYVFNDLAQQAFPEAFEAEAPAP